MLRSYGKTGSFLMQMAFIAMGTGLAGPVDQLTVEDREAAIEHLNSSRAAVVDLAKGLSPAQWSFREAAGRWSIAEIVEHLALTEDVLYDAVQTKIMRAPAGKPDRDYRSMDRMILSAVPDRTSKAQAAPGTEPSGRWRPSEALEQFRMKRERTVNYLRSARHLRDHVADSPWPEPMDAYQWLLFISAHTERHLRQMQEVMAHPRFPKAVEGE